MSDPTEIVLTASFATAIGLAGVSVLIKSLAKLRSIKVPESDYVVLEGEGTPYESPELRLSPPDLPFGKVPVGFYRVYDLLGVAFVFLVFASLILASVRVSAEMVPELNPVTLLANIGFQFVMAGMVAGMMVWRVSLVSWLGLRWRSWPWVLLIAPGAVVLMWVIFGGLQISGYLKWMESFGVETVQDTVKLLQESKDPVVLGLMAFAAVVAAPLCEELVFRGYFYPVLKRYAGIWPAAICSALVFASAHGSLTALLPLFLFGGLLVFIYEWTGSLWAPIAVHCCFNGATVLVQFLARFFDLPLDGVS